MNKTTLNSQKEKHSMLSLRRATSNSKVLVAVIELFLSTLSLRRATPGWQDYRGCRIISIHALLAESDSAQYSFMCPPYSISIHALLAESDHNRVALVPHQQDFYPRSPCGERR
mgnify:FL=1